MKAVAFDLGNTLSYHPFPLSWQAFYRDAITDVLQSIKLKATPERLQAGDSILLKYNTRVNPREYEVNSNTIFGELFREWDVVDVGQMKTAEAAFASFFSQKSELYPDTLAALEVLKGKNIKVGILTNAAYGMVFGDISSIAQYVDVFLPSTEVGFRKPHPKGYYELVGKLGIDVSECIFIGDEEVDIVGANRVGIVSVLIDRNGHKENYGQVHTINSLNEVLALI
jgi:putative hydrolase of the HAD superfamily